eukprot:1848348-Amphidinium_carterae.1
MACCDIVWAMPPNPPRSIALLLTIYSTLLHLLLGADTQFLYVTGTPAHVTSLPSFGFSTVALLAQLAMSSS